jgi:hypothetical protein
MHRYVVLADRARGFDALEDAKRFALSNFPAVICERHIRPDGTSELREILRHDRLYDPERREWRVMLASITGFDQGSLNNS